MPPRTEADQRLLRADETYICVAGVWTYLYRAVDSSRATIDFWLSAQRDAVAAKLFFQRACGLLVIPARG